MKWEKIGQIFEFDRSPFKDTFISHAQSPQALVLNDRVRIFFSSRKVDQPGQFLSYVQYVDYDLDLKNILDYSNHEVIPLGKLGCFDEHGIFPLSPVRVEEKVYGYTNGISRRSSVAVETNIGFAVSLNDGKTFKKYGDGPVLASSIQEPFMVGDAFVRIFDDLFHMFYIFGTKWSAPIDGQPSERVYKIGHATSNDGIVWQKTGKRIISDVIDENECQALPTVIKIKDRYHMFFCYRHMTGFREIKANGYRIGYAYSDDLTNWTRNDDAAGIGLSNQGWDSDMMCYPNIFECRDNIYLIYNGNNFGREGFGLAKLVEH